MTTPITVAYGDGIGPEIMQATLRVLTAAACVMSDRSGFRWFMPLL